MPAPRHRSRSLRRVYVKTPGGKTVVHYRRRKPAKAKCVCGAVLKGIPRERPYLMQNMSKSKKRSERPYGGNLCSKCTRELMVRKARGLK